MANALHSRFLYPDTSVFEVLMSKVDGRKISHDVRETIPIEAIQKWLDGVKVHSLSKEYATGSSCTYRWISRYRSDGIDALKTRPIAHSKNSKLTPE